MFKLLLQYIGIKPPISEDVVGPWNLSLRNLKINCYYSEVRSRAGRVVPAASIRNSSKYLCLVPGPPGCICTHHGDELRERDFSASVAGVLEHLGQVVGAGSES